MRAFYIRNPKAFRRSGLREPSSLREKLPPDAGEVYWRIITVFSALASVAQLLYLSLIHI